MVMSWPGRLVQGVINLLKLSDQKYNVERELSFVWEHHEIGKWNDICNKYHSATTIQQHCYDIQNSYNIPIIMCAIGKRYIDQLYSLCVQWKMKRINIPKLEDILPFHYASFEALLQGLSNFRFIGIEDSTVNEPVSCF